MPNDASVSLGFVMAGPNRIKVLKTISAMKNATPAQISKKTKVLPTNISRTMGQLESKNLIKCVTDGLRKGKIFVLTEEGKAVLAEL